MQDDGGRVLPPSLAPLSHRETTPHNKFLGALQSTILYSLTQWDSFMEGVTGLAVLDPTLTSPKGCLVRFVAFLSNPGASVTQVELRRNPFTSQYSFWVYVAKIPETEYVFADNTYELHDFIFLLLKLLTKWNIKRASEHLKQFQLDTGIREFCPAKWNSFEALLHHCLFLVSDVPRRYVSTLGWSIDFVSGDHLTINRGGKFECEYTCSYRGAISGFMDGSQHQRSCRNTPQKYWDTHPCSLCHSYRVRSELAWAISIYDLQTLVIEYSQ